MLSSKLRKNLEEIVKILDEESSDTRTVIPFSKMPTAELSMQWEFNTEDQNKILGEGENKDWKTYKKVHLYVEEGKEQVKSGYKLPIAKMVDGELKVVYRGVVAAMAALNGARAGVDVPESEREGIYRNIKKYYSLFEKEAPELRSYSDLKNLGKDNILTYDEIKMICNQIDTMVVNAVEIKHIIEMTGKAPAWVESKISVCSEKISSVRNYLIGKITDI